jgi:hypothetical protein
LPLNRTSPRGRAVLAGLSLLLIVPPAARAAEGGAPARGAAPAAPAARAARPAPAGPAFRIALKDEGVYRVNYEDLKAAGLKAKSLASRRLGLSNRGEAVPLWVEDGGDGLLGPGDWMEFVGERLPGETAHFNEYTNVNVYVLRTDVTKPLRMRAAAAPPAKRAAQPAPLTGRLHIEQDLLLLRLSGRTAKREELWYWTKLTHIDPEPFRQTLDLSDLDVSSLRPVLVRLEIRGWSQPAMKPHADLKDHRVEISVGGRVVGSDEWSNTDGMRLIELPAMAAASLKAGPLELSVRVPPRAEKPGADPMVDVVVLNWIEVEYPRVGRLRTAQARLYTDEAGPVRVIDTIHQPVALYGDDGTRAAGRTLRVEPGTPDTSVWASPGKARRLDVVVGGVFHRPDAVVLDKPSRLASKAHGADYIMVAHERLKDAVEPLAAFYRKRGLKVDVVDIQDVYDEFNHGILHPRALKDFLSHAYHSWKRPAPRWVLLVGDASWDAKNEKHDEQQYPAASFSPSHGTTFASIQAARYMPSNELRHRNLVPTWSYLTYDGHAAGDNWFVSVDGDDDLPDMAVGRFPVTEPADVAAIVEKSIRYQQQPEYGPWRNRMLWITSEQAGFLQMSDQLSDIFGKEGFSSEKVYPPKDASEGVHDQQRLREALNRGDLLVHFVGHGGRYIWRTGPPDWQKHRDLFNLDDIDKLNASDRLPVVVSMTCYSAPFDHPNADSIGEKFLRVKGKGAVAVIAASWRNAPYRTMSEDVYRALTEGGQTLGEGVQKVKRKNVHKEFLEQYNLLGDPALVMATPRLNIDLQADAEAAAGPPTVRAQIKAERFAGRAIVDWLDAKGEVASRQYVDVTTPGFTATMGATSGWDAPSAVGVRVYAWDATSGVDASGQASLSSASASLPAGKVTP